MMLRSPLPAAAASHTASHVSFPLFFFFLTSARGGAATARPLTSALLARPRPGWGEGRGRPRRERVPGARRPPGCAGRGCGPRRRAEWGARQSSGSQPPGRGTQRSRLAGAPGWGRPRPRSSGLGLGRDPESLSPRRLLSPAHGPSARPRAKGGRAEAPRENRNCKTHLQPD